MVTTLADLPNQTRCVSAAHELTHQEDCVASPAERHDLTSNSFRLIWNTSLPENFLTEWQRPPTYCAMTSLRLRITRNSATSAARNKVEVPLLLLDGHSIRKPGSAAICVVWSTTFRDTMLSFSVLLFQSLLGYIQGRLAMHYVPVCRRERRAGKYLQC